MSGGAFDYQQYRIGEIADDIDAVIRRRRDIEKDPYSYKPETILQFKEAVKALRRAEVYAQRVDWLLSGDDGEDSFHNRLRDDLSELDRDVI